MPKSVHIEVRDLHIRYGAEKEITALNGISFSIAPGERVAIIGRSGGGKSSLMQVLSGLLPPDEGEVHINGHRLTATEKAKRELYQDVGLVFQNYGLVPQLTALQNVLCGGLGDLSPLRSMGRFPAEDIERARELLVEFGLGERIYTRSSRLSGGEQQRVAMARLLFQNPPIMLLDEPVASLDVHWARRALERVMAAQDGKSTLIMVLHDLPMARQYADRVILLHGGQILFDGDPEEACCQMEMLEISKGRATDGTISPPAAIEPLAAPAQPAPALTALPQAPDGPPSRAAFYILGLAMALGLYIWAAMGVEFSLSRIFSNAHHGADFIRRMLPPDFGVTSTIVDSLIETIQMALIGTTLAAVISLPIAVLAARNISSLPVQILARTLLNLLRTVPSIIWGLFFVAVVGLGPFPGILALTFYASGYLGKFYYEGIESIDPRPLVSLRTVGTTPFQRFRWGVFPQVLPLILGYTLYMLEYNVRAASILGIVGAGGVGFYLYNYINNFQYERAATALLLLLALVTVLDFASSHLRARLMA